MAGKSEARTWADLLHNSTQLLQSAAPSAQFPPIQRNLDQLESLSRKLKARTSRLETPSQTIAATRLLAREGINADQLTRDLESFELKTSFEDVFPVEATTVEEFLQQVHEMTILSAVQEAQKDNLRAFNDYMMKAYEDDWEKERHDLMHRLSRLPVNPAASPGVSGLKQTSWSQAALPTTARALPDAREGSSVHSKLLERKAAAYAEVVMKLNASRERGIYFNVAAAFKEVCEMLLEEDKSPKSVNMVKIWYLVQSLLVEDHKSLMRVSRKMQFIVGARRHLEAGHEKYILDTIQSHPVQAALGGSTGNLQLIRAFLRVRLQDQGPLDFDGQTFRRQLPFDTAWHQIFFCLRTGYYEEAKAVAESSKVSRAFASQLTEWIATGGLVSGETAMAAAEECERMMRLGERPGRAGYEKKKMLLYAIVSGSRHLMDKLLRETPTLFNTIEDFMWFNLAVARDHEYDGASTGLHAYKIEDLQEYLLKFEPSYYTRNGKDPLVYPYILLLSLQLHAAVSYLTNESSNEGYNVDGVHIAISFADSGVLHSGVGASHKLGAMDSAAEISSIIRHYGLLYKRQGNITLALEYYAQAASCMGGGAASWSGVTSNDLMRQRQMMLKQLLTEILLAEGGIHLLLGLSGTGFEGALKRFFPDSQGQYQFLLEAARHCQDAGLYEKAIEILKRIGAFASALDIVNMRFSEAINSLARGRSDGETRAAGFLLAGNSIIESYRLLGVSSTQDRELIAERQTVLRQLETIFIFHKLGRSGKYAEAVQELYKLSFLPLGNWSCDLSSEALQNVSPFLQSCIPDLLKVALMCLDQVVDLDGTIRSMKSKIANFVANSLPKNVPKELYDRVARIL